MSTKKQKERQRKRNQIGRMKERQQYAGESPAGAVEKPKNIRPPSKAERLKGFTR